MRARPQNNFTGTMFIVFDRRGAMTDKVSIKREVMRPSWKSVVNLHINKIRCYLEH